MTTLNAKLDDFINFVKNEGSAQYTNYSRQASPNKRSPQRLGKSKSPAASLRPNLEVESRLQKMETELQTLTF